jgi:hypothetical protein
LLKSYEMKVILQALAKILVSKLRVLCDQQVALCVFLWGCRLCLLCYWLLIDKQMYLIRWLSATLRACCIAYSTQRLLTSVNGSFILQRLQLVIDSSLYQRYYVMIRLFVSTALRHDNGCSYQQHYVMTRLFISTAPRHDTVCINSITSWYGCLYQQHYVMIGCLYQQHYVMARLFI